MFGDLDGDPEQDGDRSALSYNTSLTSNAILMFVCVGVCAWVGAWVGVLCGASAYRTVHAVSPEKLGNDLKVLV